MRLLLAEDEEAMAEAVVDYLEYHHYEVDWANNGTDALERARMGAYDVLILDIMMPGMDGLTVLRTLRGEGDTTPVLLLTAKGEIRDKVQGFESGSDDYLTKPFAMEELRVRVDALTRRSQNYQGEQVAFEDLTLDKSGYAIRCGDKTVSLSHREYHLIELFIRNPHIYFSADTLLDWVWGMDADVEYGTVWVHISGLRKKLESLGSKTEIRSKRSVGYALEVIE
ncbi:MAG: response regulator transcription factor [Clostridium sp.]|nr:response regulator transcription factor [Clostridium sp.]